MTKKLDAKGYSFGHLILMLSQPYIVKYRSHIVWPLTTMKSYLVAHSSAQKLLTE